MIWLKRASHSYDHERSEQGIHRRSSKSILREVWCEWLMCHDLGLLYDWTTLCILTPVEFEDRPQSLILALVFWR